MSTWEAAQAAAKAVCDQVDADLDAARTDLSLVTAQRDLLATELEATRSERDAAVAERAAVQAAFDEHMATAHPVTEPEPEPEPTATVLMGMSTEFDRWAERVAATGPVAVRRVFSGAGWNAGSLLNRIEAAHASGCLPYASIKADGGSSGWAEVNSGGYDVRIDALATDLAGLGYPVRLGFHHEPRPASLSELAVWSRAHTRFNIRVKAIAANAIVGPVDNGFMWPREGSNVWRGGLLTDAELASYYTDAFLASCDVLGCDTYDGASDTDPGEPARFKMQAFADWARRIGFDGTLDIGEWQMVWPEDAQPTWEVLSDPANRFSAASLFNSGENNRPDLPSHLNGSWVLTGDRLAAYRTVLDQAGIPGR